MRALLFIWALALAALGAPETARAECARVAKDLCATQNGHYRIRVPKGLGPHPTVVYHYGSTGNSGEIISNDAFVQAFVSRGYAVIVPAALDVRYASGLDSGWHLRHERGKKQRNETAFVAEVLRDAEQNFVIDPKNVLMVGMSRGGFLTWEIACHNPELARAFAPVAGSYHGPMPRQCKRPVRILHTHGTADDIVPFRQDKTWNSAGARAQKVDVALERMAATGGCERAAKPTAYRDYQRTSYTGCGRDASVDLLVHKGGHTNPRSWFSAVIDWYEQGNDRPAPVAEEQSGGTAIFKGAGAGTSIGTRAPTQGGTLLKRNSSTGAKFKRAPVSQ